MALAALAARYAARRAQLSAAQPFPHLGAGLAHVCAELSSRGEDEFAALYDLFNNPGSFGDTLLRQVIISR
jgi:hypothetical protein